MARFATYSIKYRREPGCYDWQDRQQHLADLFAPESAMSFGEGKPSDEQKAKGQTHARKFNHRVHHLKCNHNIIVLQLANSIDVAMENQFETVNRRDEPSEFVIIDNRKGIRTVAIQNRKKAFSAPRKVADILQQEISTRLYKDHCYTIEIMPEYYPEDLYKLWEMRQRDIQLLRFSSPQKMEEKEVIQKAEEMQKLWPERYNATFMSQLLSIALMARKANYDHENRYQSHIDALKEKLRARTSPQPPLHIETQYNNSCQQLQGPINQATFLTRRENEQTSD